MDAGPATDAYGSELTFAMLDELARAAERGRVKPSEFLASRRISRLGPMVELLLLDRHGALPLDGIPESGTLRALNVALSPSRAQRGEYVTSADIAFGFITTGRDIITPDSIEGLQWVGFCQKAQQAAERSLPKLIAHGLIGAMTEIEENVHLHSERRHDGVVGFRGTSDEFEFVIADSGIGMLASLRRSPDYQDLTDSGKALRLALQDGQSRLSYLEPDHGYGFRTLFRNLATLNGALRFRSDDQAVTIEGVGPELVKSTLSQKTHLQGFAANIVCRPRAK